MFLFHVEAVNIVEKPIPCFGDDRETDVAGIAVCASACDIPLNHGIAHCSHAVSIRNENGTPQASGLLNPRCPRHFTVPVEREPGSKDAVFVVLSFRKNDGHSGSNGPPSDDKFSFAGDDGLMAYLNPQDISDGVVGSRGSVKRKTEVTSTRRLSADDGENENRRNEGGYYAG